MWGRKYFFGAFFLSFWAISDLRAGAFWGNNLFGRT
jgi:hypothetical protein